MSPPREADPTITVHVSTGALIMLRVASGAVIKQLERPPIVELNKAELDLLDLARKVHRTIVIE